MSIIDEAMPTEGAATTQSVRDNFAAAKAEITALENRPDDPGYFNDTSTIQLYASQFGNKLLLACAPKYSAIGSAGMTAGRRQAQPIFFPRQLEIESLRIRVTTTHASNFQIGIYAADTTNPMMPGEKLWGSDDLTANVAQIYTMICPITLQRDTLYYLVNHFAGTPQVRNLAASDLIPFFPAAATDVQVNWPILSQNLTYEGLPANLSASALIPAQQSIPAIQIKRV